MLSTRNILINNYEINYANIPTWVKNYLDGKVELTRKTAIYLEDFLFLPKGTRKEIKRFIRRKCR